MCVWLYMKQVYFLWTCVHTSLTLHVQVRMDTWRDCLESFSMLGSWAFCFCLRHVQKLAVIALHKKINVSLYSVPAVLRLVCPVLTALSSNKWSLGAVLCIVLLNLSTSSVSSCDNRLYLGLPLGTYMCMFLSECGCRSIEDFIYFIYHLFLGFLLK